MLWEFHDMIFILFMSVSRASHTLPYSTALPLTHEPCLAHTQCALVPSSAAECCLN